MGFFLSFFVPFFDLMCSYSPLLLLLIIIISAITTIVIAILTLDIVSKTALNQGEEGDDTDNAMHGAPQQEVHQAI